VASSQNTKKRATDPHSIRFDPCKSVAKLALFLAGFPEDVARLPRSALAALHERIELRPEAGYLVLQERQYGIHCHSGFIFRDTYTLSKLLHKLIHELSPFLQS
jgi:hypothetical protein